MRAVAPEVHLIAGPLLWTEELHDYLDAIGAAEWESNAETDAEQLVEIGGKVCYRSWKPGLNPNVTKVRDDNKAYLANMLAQYHGSVFEHANLSFILHHVSRVFTHEIVRHRAGCAISQESMRYVALTDIPFWTPSCFTEDPDEARRAAFRRDSERLLQHMEDFQQKWRAVYGLDGEDFARKKEFTSGLRRWAPQGVATGMLWTANFRTLRHVIEVRTDPGAEEEIRLVFDQIAALVTERFPAGFQDMVRSPNGQWVPKFRKV